MKSEYEQFIPELSSIMHSIGESYMVTHLDDVGLITYTNKAFLETSKWTPKWVLGQSLWKMFPETNAGQEQAHLIWKSILSGKTWSGTAEKITRHGDSYFVKLTAVPIIRKERGLIAAIFLELDVTADMELRKKLQDAAFTDYETGLMSRYSLETTAAEFIAQNKSFSFVYITIDQFYTLQDFQKDSYEKELVHAFTNRLKRYFEDNPIARLGANEFVVLTPFGEWYIEAFLEFLKQQPIYIDTVALPLTVSGGMIRYPEDQKTYTHLMKAALAATKEVSKSGGGKILSLSEASHKKLNRKAVIDRKLLTALNENNLQVVYQPLLDIATGNITQFEALVRWEDDELGWVSPGELIPIAEENGSIHKLGTFVLKKSAELATQWKLEGHEVPISVNTSVLEFSNPQWKMEVMKILQDAGCPPSLIHLEITEIFAFQAEVESSISHQMRELQGEGIEFTLDDFGTGYASFRYMQYLPIDNIKIDSLFTQSLTTHPKTKQLVEGMIQFAKSMGLTVIAEGVETEEQFEMLKTMGIDAVQGYYIGVPTAAENIILSK